MAKWITDRQPTKDDGDFDGEVAVRRSPLIDEPFLMHWSYVGPSTPWKHLLGWMLPEPQPASAAPTIQPRRFASISRTIVSDEDHIIDAIADDGTAWFLHARRFSTWMPLRPLPEYEVAADA